MKRTVVVLASVAAVSVMAFQHPEHAELPNFDRRTDGAPAVRSVAPVHADAVSALKSRVPNLEVTTSRVLGKPAFFSARDSFLTGSNAEGKAVQANSARALKSDDPHRAVKAFLNEHSALVGYGAEALDQAVMRRDYVTRHNGMRTVIWQQQAEGIQVFDAITMGHITRDGELVNLHTEFVQDAPTAAARGLKGKAPGAAAASVNISAAEALVIGARHLGENADASQLKSRGGATGAARKEVFSGAGPFNGDQYAELVWLPLNANTLRLCWQAIVVSKTRGEGFLFVIDADTGEVIIRRCLTHYISDASYRVYVSDSPSPFSPGHFNPSTIQPPIVNRQLVVTPAFNTNASPNGWIDDGVNETRGNNVDAHGDTNDDDQPDLPRPQGNPNRVFDFPADLTQAPGTYTPAAIVNLFYWNNVIHDRLYELGFTEAAGNFQVNNFGRGGLGGDAVAAQAQDGGGFNNANMLTLPDGFPPRMQMYIFDGPNPDRDGDFDNEIVIHEYVHGLSNRRVGGGIGIFQLQTAGMGEGWSDFYALCLLAETSDAIDGNFAAGGYATFELAGLQENYYYGIRRFPYSTNLSKNPLTFKDIDPTQASPHAGIPRNPIFGPFTPFDAAEVHNQGEVWCVTLWEMRANLISKYGPALGNQIALQLVTDAMALCPPNPNFLQSRDAILLADRVNNNNANYSELWRAFAKRGMGSSATSPDSSTTIGIVESYDFPGLSLGVVQSTDTTSGNGNGAIDPNECIELFLQLKNNSVATAVSINAALFTTTPGVTIVQGASAYPNLLPTAVGYNLTPFRIYTAPNFVCGSRIQLSLVSTSSAPNVQVNTNTFELRTGFVALTPALFNNNTPVAIPDANTNGASSTINVAGLGGALGKLNVSLHLTHTAVGDLVIELIGPDGTTIALAKNQGANGDNFGTACNPHTSRTTFDDNAAFEISVGNPPYVGTFRPDEPLDVFEGKSGAALNGQWRLRVVDSAANDVGILQCWTLSLFPTVCSDGGGPCLGDLGVNVTASPVPGVTGQDLTYSVAVTNTRPFSVPNVVLSNVLPASVSFVSASSPNGTCTVQGGVVRCVFGTMNPAAGASAVITVRPLSVGQLTNVFSVGGSTADAAPADNRATVVTQIVPALATVVPWTAQLLGDSSGGVEAGETVTMNLALRNVGTAATTNLIATLLSGSGVNSPSGSQVYGAIPVGGNAAQPFSFTASGNAGDTISAVLQLQDGVQNLGTATFHFTLGGDIVGANGAEIVINQFGSASPYPSTINISGVAGFISKVRVTLSKLSHTFPDDIDALLAGPGGKKLVLMSDAGGGNAIANRTLTFDASAAGSLPNESLIASGDYLPTDFNSGTEPGGDVFPAPAPAGALSSSLLAFNGGSPNGAWSLFIHDDGGNDGGVVSGGWGLNISVVVPVNPFADLSIAASASPNPAVVGELLTYTLTVANAGPSNAPSVVVTDTLPAGVTFASASATQGTVNESGGVVTANLGTLNSGASATVTVRVTPNSSGAKVNTASVTSAATDLNLANNSATTSVPVNDPVADLALSVIATPTTAFVSSNVTFQIVVTNRGPNHADSLRVTKRLAPAFAFVLAQTSQGTTNFVDGVITFDFGSLPAFGTATGSVVATAFVPGRATNLFAIVSPTADPVSNNNNATVVTEINALAPLIVSSGVALTSESIVPANSAVESGETVTVSFGLRNVGVADAGNLVATLAASGGISSPSGAQNYGALAANGPTVSRSFSFTANAAAGGSLLATLQLQDGGADLGTVVFQFGVSANQSFTNTGAIIIPASGAASIYPATQHIAGVTGTVSKVTVALRQFTHSFPEDVDVLLVGPGGQKAMLMSDAGGSIGVNGINLTLDDAGLALPAGGPLTSGSFHAMDYAPGDNFPSPAPSGPYGTNLSVFNAVNPNGTWSLFVFDDANGDAGRIDGGWALHLQTATPVVSSADLAVTGTAPAGVVPGGNFTYTISVANHGPAAASAVVLNSLLPSGFNLSAVNVSQGNYVTGAGTVTANLGALSVGAGATVTISGSASGNATNTVTVSGGQADANIANNSAAIVALASAPGMTIRLTGTNAVIAWPAPSTGFVLETSASLAAPWSSVGSSPVVVNGHNQVTVPANGTAFYRLRKP